MGKSADEIVALVDDAYKAALRVDLNASSDLLEALGKNPKLIDSWKKLSDLTGTREWTRTSIPLLEKMSGKSDDFMDKVR